MSLLKIPSLKSAGLGSRERKNLSEHTTKGNRGDDVLKEMSVDLLRRPLSHIGILQVPVAKSTTLHT